MRIGGIVDTSTVDWYGNVSLVVFFAGCNFRCPYCQNSPLIPLDSGEEVNLDLLEKRIDIAGKLIDAVVFTGGEPLLQKSLGEAAMVVKDRGLKLMVDTNGSIPMAIEPLLAEALVDRVALDVKAPLRHSTYGTVIGLGSNVELIVDRIRQTLDKCVDHGVEIEVRTTVAPTITDDADMIKGISRDIRDKCNAYYLQQFDNTGEVLSPELKSMQPPTRERMLELAYAALEEGVENVFIKTRRFGLEKIG